MRPAANSAGVWNPRCGANPLYCYGTDPKTGARTQDPAYGTITIINGRASPPTVWCPNDGAPALTMAAIRQEALRLLPKVQIGSAWPVRALVNAQTILWAVTDPNRTLGAVTVVGRRVALRLGFDHATWNFGDGHTDTTSEPGRVYQVSDDCNTAQCPGYYGHTYTDTGHVTITLTVSWNAQYSLDNGATWTDIGPGALTGPAVTHPLQLVQARGVLVPDP